MHAETLHPNQLSYLAARLIAGGCCERVARVELRAWGTYPGLIGIPGCDILVCARRLQWQTVNTYISLLSQASGSELAVAQGY